MLVWLFLLVIFWLLRRPLLRLLGLQPASAYQPRPESFYPFSAQFRLLYRLYSFPPIGQWITKREQLPYRGAPHTVTQVLHYGDISVLPVPYAKDNYGYLLHSETRNTTVAIDVGEWEPMEEALERQNWPLSAAMITHWHWDHSGGLPEMRKELPGIPVYGPKDEGAVDVTHPMELRNWEPLDEEIEGIKLRLTQLPGHTRAGILIHCLDSQRGLLFTGDLLFTAGAGMIFEGRLGEMAKSLAAIRELDPACLVFPGHEYGLSNLSFAASLWPESENLQRAVDEAEEKRRAQEPLIPTTLAEELKTNPFLRIGQADLSEALGLNAREAEDSQVLYALRKGKDNFAA